MSDLVERLRKAAIMREDLKERYWDRAASLKREAAEEILRLRSENERIRNEAMEEAAKVAESVRAPKSIGRDHGRHHEAGAQSAARAIRALSQANTEERGEE